MLCVWCGRSIRAVNFTSMIFKKSVQCAVQLSARCNEVCNLCTLFILRCAAVWSVCKVQCGRGMGALYNRNILTMRSNWERLKSHSLLHCLCWLYQRRSQGNKSQSNPDTRMVYKGSDLHLIFIATPMRFHDSPVLFLLQSDSRWDHQPILLALGIDRSSYIMNCQYGSRKLQWL